MKLNIKKIFKLLIIFLVLFLIIFLLLIYYKTKNVEGMYDKVSKIFETMNLKIYNFKLETKDSKNDIRIKTYDNKHILIPYNRSNDINRILEKYNVDNKNQYDELKKQLIFVNTITWKYKSITPNNKYNKPIGIKINENEVLLCENNKIPEIYNHKTKKFELLSSIEYNLGNLYYQNKLGEVLFINDDSIIVFYPNTKQFKKISDGIKNVGLGEDNYQYLILPYSNEYIYICIFKPIYKNNFSFDTIVRLNLKNYKYKVQKITNSPNIRSYGIVNNNEIVLIEELNNDIYFYDVNNNNFEKKAVRKDNGHGYFYIFQYDKDNLLLLPNYPDILFQIVNLNNMQTDVLYAALDHNSFHYVHCSPILINKNIIFPNGIIFNTEKNKIYYPDQLMNIYQNNCNLLLLPLNDKEFLRLGCSDKESEYAENGSIISIEKFNNDEFYMLDIERFNLVSQYIYQKRRK